MLSKFPQTSFPSSASPSRLLVPVAAAVVRASPIKPTVSKSSASGALGRGKPTAAPLDQIVQMEQAIRQRLPGILASCDLDTLTERGVRGVLEAELGASVADHKNLIKGLIEAFLDSKADDDDDEEEEEDFEPAAGAKRKAGQPAAKPAKVMKVEGTGGGGFSKELARNKFASVKQFKNKVQVDLREYYEDKATGEKKPGPSGLPLTFDQWLLLKAGLPALQDALGNKTETVAEPLQLSATRHAYVKLYQSKYSVHVREMYEKDGSMLPGKKGVTLDTAGVAELVAQADQITAAAQRLGAKSEGEGPAAAASSASAPAAAPAKRQAMQENVRPEASGAGKPEKDSAGVAAAAFVDLGSEKRATVKEFKGKTYVDLREFYVKDGEKLPGKKGISLNPEAFKTIAQNAAAITAAFASASASYELDLGSKVKVTVAAWKGKMYANVREYYEKDGEMKPGLKGLGMNSEQWSKLVAGLPDIEAKLGSLS